MPRDETFKNFSDLTVFVPVWNEEKTIRQAVGRMVAELPGATIVVIDDGSSDATFSQIAECNLTGVYSLQLSKNSGKGAAIKHGIASFSFDTAYFAYFDGDMDLHPRSLAAGFLELCNNPELGGVIGSKLHPDSQVDYPWYRRAASRLYSFVLWLLFRISIGDSQTGLKIFRTASVQDIVPTVVSNGWAFDVEILLEIFERKIRVAEIPVDLHYGFDTSISARGAVTVLIDTVEIWRRWRTRPQVAASTPNGQKLWVRNE